ncbi:MAG: hypothetical protein VR73_10325 [Gammaproteobacteria bacterium BRH_c0]|nr:MAG: hypothetical protein VR73_10325 [Gammaproteobacteria bacterium BRH_c0]
MTDHFDERLQQQTMLADSADKCFADLCSKDTVNAAEAGQWPTQLWDTLTDLGFLSALVPEQAGGLGLHPADILPTVRIAGRYAAPVPYGETIIAGWLLGRVGLPVPQAPLAFGPVDRNSTLTLSPTAQGWLLNGRLRQIPWGNSVERIAVLCETADGLRVASIDPKNATQSVTTNLAGEPRVALDFTDTIIAGTDVKPAPADIQANTLYLYGALLRSLQMAGALITARDLAVQYTSERIAFGKPLNRLQAVQQNLAVLAGQTAAANVAVDMALDALAQGSPDTDIAIAMAKIRTNAAAEIAARLAHQSHGAIGFSHEHPLHHATRRLWSWRDEFGNEAYWAERVGQRVIDAGSEEFWPLMTRAAQL